MAATRLFATSLLALVLTSPAHAEEGARTLETTPPAATSTATGDAAPTSPTPRRYSFRTSNVFDGKVGLGSMYMRSDPFGAATGYGQLFAQGDWDGIGGSGFGFHFDIDTRFSLYEARDPRIAGVDNSLGDVVPADKDAFYRRVGTFVTGRSYDYLRIDQLYGSWNSDDFGFAFGRMLVTAAAQAPVDGLQLSIGLGGLGRAGMFAGLKANPWHQQVVGAMSGGTLMDGAGQLFAPLWGDLVADPFGYATTGPYANELGAGIPWLQLGSLRFLTTGAYAELRTSSFSVDTALVVDLFDWSNLDRVWGHATGGWRVLENLTVSFRGTVDVLGARPLAPRDLYLDVSWRNLGPLTLQASYFKFNTVATAFSYATYFRPLEDPDKTILAKNPFGDDALGVTESQNLYATNLNNTQLFVVDRDRVNLGAALNLGGTLEVYGELLGERRGDVAYTQNADIGQAMDGLVAGLEGLFAGCAFDAADPLAPKGSNPKVPVYADLCRFGGTVGVRDPFLGGVGAFDLQATWLEGYFQSTTRVSSHVGVALGDVLWAELGGALENNHNHRVYVSYNPVGGNGTPQYLARATHAYLVDASLAWRIWEGLSLEASYFGYLEEVPFQGDTIPTTRPPETPRETTQYTQTVYARTLYRF